MRFHADGPEIPDDLLVARDDGQVLFFCGSGVSIANAGLPGFLGLAEQVLAGLRALPDSPSRQLLDINDVLQKHKVSGVGSVVAADRLFGLLEREFASSDIERAVGEVLHPKTGVDLSAHHILLDLSRTPNGSVQLVTTNFDLLFEAAAPREKTWSPSNLPNLQHGGFNGILHLHGMFDAQYQHAVGGALVLSSAEFGRAYLSEGWATRFIQDAIEKFSVVFVGYTADDPPVQYLLEALNRNHRRPQRPMYAFQPGLQSEATALWGHRGVTAIPYETRNQDHSALWKTLAAWSERARNPQTWRDRVLVRAMRGPEALLPHERGQVMHLAMTPDGVKSIVRSKRLLPANWLLVFDPAERYETPGRRTFTAEAATFDNFKDYGIDSDPLPPPDIEGQPLRKREVPDGVLNAFLSNQFDPAPSGPASLYGRHAEATIPLPDRLLALTAWIAQNKNQPLTVWWALNKTILHHRLLEAIEHQLNYRDHKVAPLARKAWRYILEASKPKNQQTTHGLQARIKWEGWSPSVHRDFAELISPRLKVSRPLISGPAKQIQKLRQFQFFHIKLEYDNQASTIAIPDDQLTSIVPIVRRALEDASVAEQESSPFVLNHIPPFNPDPRLVGRTYERDLGFNRLVFWYKALFERLLVIYPAIALREFHAWQSQDNTLFERLRIWACSLTQFLPNALATTTLANASDSGFWSGRGERDLLLSLAARWSHFDASERKIIQSRLLKGPPRYTHGTAAENRIWRAHAVLSRVGWLIKSGCKFDVPVEPILQRARRDAPQWKDEYADRAADSHEGTSGQIHTDTTFDHIASASIRELLPRALADSGRDHDHFVEHDPFSGLAERKPVRVLRALLLETLPPEQNQRAWAVFLQSPGRGHDKLRFANLVGCRIMRLSDAAFAGALDAILYWLEHRASGLYSEHRPTVEDLIDRSTAVVASLPMIPHAHVKRQRDWLNSVQGSSGGRLVEILCRDPSLDSYPVGASLPKEWLHRIGACLALPGDDALFALFQITQRLQWLFAREAGRAEKMILAALDRADDSREVVLAGFLNNPEFGERSLYNRLKPPIMKLTSGDLTRPEADPRALAYFLLSGWLTIENSQRWLSDMEMRTALVRGEKEFRQTILWQIAQWEFDDKFYFLSQVWPLQIAARSETITDRLCSIAMKDQAHFENLATAVMPFLTKMGKGSIVFGEGEDTDAIFAAHPKIALEMFWRILPEESADWPYGIHQQLESLHNASKSIRSDPRMIELMRRRHKGYF